MSLWCWADLHSCSSQNIRWLSPSSLTAYRTQAKQEIRKLQKVSTWICHFMTEPYKDSMLLQSYQQLSSFLLSPVVIFYISQASIYKAANSQNHLNLHAGCWLHSVGCLHGIWKCFRGLNQCVVPSVFCIANLYGLHLRSTSEGTLRLEMERLLSMCGLCERNKLKTPSLCARQPATMHINYSRETKGKQREESNKSPDLERIQLGESKWHFQAECGHPEMSQKIWLQWSDTSDGRRLKEKVWNQT